VSVLSRLAQQVLGDRGPVDWAGLESHRTIRALIADVIPGLEQMGEIDRTKQEFYIPGRHLDRPSFPTVSGKARFHGIPLRAAVPVANRQLRLMTVRSEGQFNTVVFEEEDIYRGQDRRDVILMNPADMTRLGLTRDQRVTVRSAAGALRNQLVRPFDVRAGNALMYYPEGNALVPRDVDPRSKTPAFKDVLIEIE
jgi:anaerobic selenocysteine-containing dehydrogenase